VARDEKDRLSASISRKTTMLRSYECLVIEIAEEDHPRSFFEKSNLSRAMEANNKWQFRTVIVVAIVVA